MLYTHIDETKALIVSISPSNACKRGRWSMGWSCTTTTATTTTDYYY